MKLTVYDGAGVIGGNKILLEADRTSVFFDFGTTFAYRGLYFEEYLKPRASRGVLDLITMGLLPPLAGLYRDDLLLANGCIEERMRRRSGFREVGQVEGILLSHAHIDHSGYISFVRGDVPVYSTAMTAVIAKAMQDSSVTDFEKEVCYQIPREEREGILGASHYKKAPSLGRQYYALDGPAAPEVTEFWGTSCSSRSLDCRPLLPASTVGTLPIRTFPVDHSIFGAAAFALETELGWVVYTGDIRLHGKRGICTRRFMEEAAKLKPYLLVCEGTHVDSVAATSEEEVHENCLSAVKGARGLVIADFGPRNVERLISFRDIARETGRKLGILAKDAYLLEAMSTADRGMPDISLDDTICLYRDIKAVEAKWERALLQRYLERGKVIDAGEVNRHQSEYVLCLSFWDVNELVDLDPEPGGVYVYSSSEAYGEEQKIDHQRLANWLDAFGMECVGLEGKGYHASGHITGPDLLKLIETIRPQVLVPIHTLKTGFFTDNLRGICQVVVPERGKEIVFQ